ncbi:hypothetical protein LILAB_25085 [Corallococcus macrosporus]|uniref:Uncharacterized protein n=1 Tax=Myxococcus fulvus (strain ATCC BAA-855 / HW-1) TaxID=483219 RepID=F8C6W8_MYXFH|nr:hypothetical protein LILAB_25085 [Corallococcus macrosporus]
MDFMLERAGAEAPPDTAGVEREGGGAPCGAAMNTCPQRVHWTEAPPGGSKRESRTYCIEH